MDVKSKLTKAARGASWKATSLLHRPHAAEVLHHRIDPLGWGFDEYVWVERNGAVLEPSWGYVIAEPFTLRPDSMSVRFSPTDTAMSLRYGTPSLLAWLANRRPGRGRVMDVDRAISLRYFYEWNYYHFYFDVLARLQLIDDVVGDPTIPVVVGPYADELAYARDLRRLGAFADREWIVQPRDTYIRAKELYYARPRMRHAELINYVHESLRIGETVDSREERIFLTRRTGNRLLVNGDVVGAMLAERGFRIVDAAALDVVEQIDLFRNTRVLVAIHGAGLTNMIFRRGQPLSVVELGSERYFIQLFEAIAYQLGFDHARFICADAGGDDPQLADLRADEVALAELVDDVIAGL